LRTTLKQESYGPTFPAGIRVQQLMIFKDRRHAGRLLAAEVSKLGLEDVIVLAIPRGGVPVAYEVAKILRAPLDVVIARKIGAPGFSEYAIGAVSADGAPVLDVPAIVSLRVPREYIERETAAKAEEVKERMESYRGALPYPSVEGKTLVVIDDGIATGSTVKAAVRWLRRRNPRLIVLATPVAPPETIRELSSEVDRVVCLSTPSAFSAVGEFYEDFSQLEDSDVIEILREHRPD